MDGWIKSIRCSPVINPDRTSIEYTDITIDAISRRSAPSGKLVSAFEVDIIQTKVSNTCTKPRGVMSHNIPIASACVYII